MQITTPNKLSALYGSQAGAKPQPEKMERALSPAAPEKAATVSLSAEALRKQAEAKKREDAASKDAEQTRQQQTQTAALPVPTRSMAAPQRIDLMA